DACAVYVVTGPGEGGAPVVLSVAAASRDPEGPDIDAGACLAEIATATAVPLGTAKSRLFHARRQLRDLLEGDPS
ncbi:MAG: hypothetical protein AAFR09_04080, partial [Pseudomonadota bacterium]